MAQLFIYQRNHEREGVCVRHQLTVGVRLTCTARRFADASGYQYPPSRSLARRADPLQPHDAH